MCRSGVSFEIQIRSSLQTELEQARARRQRGPLYRLPLVSIWFWGKTRTMFKQLLVLQAGPLLIVLKYYTELAKALIWHFSCLRHAKYSSQMVRSICKLRLKWAVVFKHDWARVQKFSQATEQCANVQSVNTAHSVGQLNLQLSGDVYMRDVHRCKSRERSSQRSRLFGLFRDDPVPQRRDLGLFDEEGNDVSRMLWRSQSPNRG